LSEKNPPLKEMPMGKNSESKIYKYYIICFFTILAIIFAIFLPILNLFTDYIKIITIGHLGNALIISIILITLVDVILLLGKKINFNLLPFLSMTLSIALFLLMEYCFLNDLFGVMYVWSNSKFTQPIIYKIVAIWAGQSGSIMTWMVFNSIVLFFFRFKFQKRNSQKGEYDFVFIVSCIIGLIVFVVFQIILYILAPFQVTIFPFLDGNGLSSALISPFLIWHPFFTYVAYAIFLVPFSVVIAEVIINVVGKVLNLLGSGNPPKYRLQSSYQKTFNEFALKFGWLVITLSIGLGAYWAKIAPSWDRYWGWDPVETVSLLPWIFSTAYFHTMSFRKSNSKLFKINIVLIFFSVVFSTLVTRGGGLSSLHSFTGTQILIFWVVIIGGILLLLTIYILYDVLNNLYEEYKKPKLFLDYLSYLFLIIFIFVCLMGLYLPPLTNFLANFIPLNTITIGNAYYLFTIVPAIGLAVTLIYCSLWDVFKIKSITIVLIIGIIVSMPIGLLSHLMIIPIVIFSFSGVSALISIIIQFDVKKGFIQFFRINSKKIIHLGISLIFIGFLTGKLLITDIVFISGFFFLLIGIIPSIFMVFLRKKRSNNSD